MSLGQPSVGAFSKAESRYGSHWQFPSVSRSSASNRPFALSRPSMGTPSSSLSLVFSWSHVSGSVLASDSVWTFFCRVLCTSGVDLPSVARSSVMFSKARREGASSTEFGLEVLVRTSWPMVVVLLVVPVESCASLSLLLLAFFLLSESLRPEIAVSHLGKGSVCALPFPLDLGGDAECALRGLRMSRLLQDEEES